MIESSTALMTGKVRVFASYDRMHDKDLHDQLEEQASRSTSGFEISDHSRLQPSGEVSAAGLRSSIRDAEQVIVICGEYSDGSEQMGTELRIAKEEKRPCLFLWGRRDPMCTRPDTAAPTDRMYSWTPDNLQSQIQNLRRISRADAEAAERARLTAESQS